MTVPTYHSDDLKAERSPMALQMHALVRACVRDVVLQVFQNAPLEECRRGGLQPLSSADLHGGQSPPCAQNSHSLSNCWEQRSTRRVGQIVPTNIPCNDARAQVEAQPRRTLARIIDPRRVCTGSAELSLPA